MRIIVTGGAGFIGSAVIRHLIGKPEVEEILNVDKLTYAGNLASLKSVAENPAYAHIQVDIRHEARLTHVFKNYAPDAVIHLAAESHVDRSIDGSRPFIETNILGTYTLLETARRYWAELPKGKKEAFRFLHVSTDEVYGSLGAEGLFTEETPYDPSSPYAASKAASDHLARAWVRTYGLPVIVTNCSNNYGPYQFPEKLIPHMILNALEGKSLPIYGEGTNVRDWLYVDDHARALALILRKGVPGETYNIGGRNERTNRVVVGTVCAILNEMRPRGWPGEGYEREGSWPGGGYEKLIEYVLDRPGHDHRYAINAAKLETELGWKAEETFATGLRKTVEWYLENEWWWGPLRRNVYGGERIGLAV